MIAPGTDNTTSRHPDGPEYCGVCDVDDGTSRGRAELPLGSAMCDGCWDRLICDVEADRLDSLTRPDEVATHAAAGRATVDRQRVRRSGTLPAKFGNALNRALAAGDETAHELRAFLEVAAHEADDFGRLLSLPRLIAAYTTATGCGERTAQRRRRAAVGAGWLVHSQRGHLGRPAIYLLAVPRRWRWRSGPGRLSSITCTTESTKSALSPDAPSPARKAPGTGPSTAGNDAPRQRSGPEGWMCRKSRSRASGTLLGVPGWARARLTRAEKLALLPLVDLAIRRAEPYPVSQALRGHLTDARDVAAVIRWRLRQVVADHPAERPSPRPPRSVDETGQRWAAARLTPDQVARNRRHATAIRAQIHRR